VSRRLLGFTALFVILGGAAAGGAAAACSTFLQEPEFRAQTRLLLQPEDASRILDPFAPLPQDDSTVDSPGRRLWTHAEEIESDRVAEAVRDALQLDDTVRELSERVSAEPVGLGYAIQITATGKTADEAIDLANAFADEYIAYLRAENARVKEGAAEAISASLARAADDDAAAILQQLEIRRQELLIESDLPTPGLAIVNTAVEADQTAPDPVRSGGLGGLLGGLVVGGFALAFRLSRRAGRGLPEPVGVTP
jgi:uncharacterized protein involved in exopolysaccharide biosynthesis